MLEKTPGTKGWWVCKAVLARGGDQEGAGGGGGGMVIPDIGACGVMAFLYSFVLGRHTL